MGLDTNLKGRLRNTKLPLASGLLPLFEAVVNSVHAIEETSMTTDRGLIKVEILRQPKKEELDFGDKRGKIDGKTDITGFRITDNGIGFNTENMKSFSTLDSDHKIKKGGRGIGRIFWLKVFNNAIIESIFKSTEGKPKQIRFSFDAIHGINVKSTTDVDAKAKSGTIIELNGFDANYRTHVKKTAMSIADSLLEHCLWYFLKPSGAPEISVEDGDEIIHLKHAFEELMYSNAFSETIKIKGRAFDLIHTKLKSNSLSAHTIAFCADQRLVKEEKLSGKIPGLYNRRIPDDNGDFIYSCYVSSDFLNERAYLDRIEFDIMESIDGLLEAIEISMADIREAVIECSKKYLTNYLNSNKEKSKERLAHFVSKRSPRYRPILSRIPEDQLDIDPEISDKDLDLALHKHFATLESELLEEGHNIMGVGPGKDFPDYEQRLIEYLNKAEDIKKSDLVSYVSKRRVILDIFEKAVQRDGEGNYVREDLIHQLIMPRWADSNTTSLNAGNLWLVDERLAFHDYLASDKTINSMPITSATDGHKPDICALNIFDNPLLLAESFKPPLASLVIIEIKRPLRNNYSAGDEDDPIEQSLGYLDRIRKGEMQTATGRPILGAENVPGFCYILADLTSTLIHRCKLKELIPTADGNGYFGYSKNFNAYIEVFSFDRMLSMAKERNRAFFDKLGFSAN